jgi:hypothetical protein
VCDIEIVGLLKGVAVSQGLGSGAWRRCVCRASLHMRPRALRHMKSS